MSHDLVDSTPDFASLFLDVAESWDLPKLYRDLASVRQRALDEIEKAYLRGLLHFGNRTRLAEDLGVDPESLRGYLQQHIYPYIGKLTNQQEVSSSRIREYLRANGYFTAQEATPDIERLFSAVENLWDLPKLYEDLEDLQDQPLNATEKAYLRGLLQCGSRTQLADKLDIDPEDLRGYLQAHLYPCLRKLTGQEEIASSRIGEWLKAKGYFKRALKGDHAILSKRIIVGLGGLAFAIFSAVIAESVAECLSEGVGIVQCLFPEGNQRRATFKEVSAPAGTFTYGGSTTWIPIQTKLEEALKTAKPKFQLRYFSPIVGEIGSNRGLEMLLDNRLSFALSSRPVEAEEYQSARDKGFELREVQIAIDGIAIAVHPSLDIPGLSTTQLRDIYLGEIQNWQEVGGPNLAITLYSRPSDDTGGEILLNDDL